MQILQVQEIDVRGQDLEKIRMPECDVKLAYDREVDTAYLIGDPSLIK